MNKNSAEAKLIKNLVHMLSTHDDYFEENTARFMLTQVGKEKIQNSMVCRDYCRITLNSNLRGIIDYIFPKTQFPAPRLEDYIEKNGAEDYEIDIKDYNQSLGKRQCWEKLLKEVSPELLTSPTYYLIDSRYTEDGNPPEIGRNGMLILRDATQWAKAYLANPAEYQLTQEEEKIFAINLAQESQYFNIYSLKHVGETEVSLLLNIFTKHQEAVKDLWIKKENESLSGNTLENAWVSKLLASRGLKNLLVMGELEDVSPIFSEKSLKSLITRSKIKENVIRNPDMLSNLLGIAPPEKWIKAYSTGGDFNINSYFNEKFKIGHKISLLKDIKKSKIKGGYVNASNAILEELSYLEPALKNSPIKPTDLLHFWTQVLEANDLRLFKAVTKALPLPEENDKSSSFYYSFRNRTIKDYRSNSPTYENSETAEGWYRLVKYEEMQASLAPKEIAVKKKLKI